MFGSQPPPKRHNPHQPTAEESPHLFDRYAPADSVRLLMYDVDGKPVVVYLSRRAAAGLAEDIRRELDATARKGGAS